MKLSTPPLHSSVFSRRFSPLAYNKGSSPKICRSLAVRNFGLVGFTLIELLIVVAIIAILAGLSFSTLGYVNRKGADSRARSEVAALSAAIEAYKLDTGFYPPSTANPYANTLYANLCPSNPNARVYFEPAPGILATNNGSVQFTDPWGTAYGYSNSTTYFDLWSTAGASTTAVNTNDWIRN